MAIPNPPDADGAPTGEPLAGEELPIAQTPSFAGGAEAAPSPARPEGTSYTGGTDAPPSAAFPPPPSFSGGGGTGSTPVSPTSRLPLALLGIGLVIGSVGGGIAGGALVASRQPATVLASPSGQPTSNPVASTSPAPSASSSGTSGLSAGAIFQQDSPGVVTITTDIGSNFRNFGQATGTGIVLDTQGDILTNQHVVASASQVRVTFSDGQTVAASITGTDLSDDLATIRVSVAASRLHPLALANSDTVQVGDSVLAIGTPFGLAETLTSGIVSGLNRTSTSPSGRALTGLIQTDTAINPGNSGGPLLNVRGEVIGINESIQSPIQGSVGVGFAVASNTATRVLNALEKGQAIQHPWLGIEGRTITAADASSLGLSRQSGILVVQVVAGGPAAAAGLQASGTPDSTDDIITAVDGHSISTIEDLTTYLNTKKVGERVTLTVVRGGRTISVGLSLGNFVDQSGG